MTYTKAYKEIWYLWCSFKLGKNIIKNGKEEVILEALRVAMTTLRKYHYLELALRKD